MDVKYQYVLGTINNANQIVDLENIDLPSSISDEQYIYDPTGKQLIVVDTYTTPSNSGTLAMSVYTSSDFRNFNLTMVDTGVASGDDEEEVSD